MSRMVMLEDKRVPQDNPRLQALEKVTLTGASATVAILLDENRLNVAYVGQCRHSILFIFVGLLPRVQLVKADFDVRCPDFSAFTNAAHSIQGDNQANIENGAFIFKGLNLTIVPYSKSVNLIPKAYSK